MNKLRLYTAIVLLLGVAGYLAYQLYLPVMIAKSITGEASFLVPESIETRVRKIRMPVNDGAQAVIEKIHQSGITMDQVLKAIDNAREAQALAMLAELNTTEVTDADEVFSIAKKHFPVDFDVEIFREPFRERVSPALIRKGIHYANSYKDREEFDAQTVKSIVKRILMQKEAEFNRIVKK